MNQMTNCQRRLLEASNQLNLEIQIPYSFTVRDELIKAEALPPQLGGVNGHLVFNDYEAIRGRTADVYRQGYTVSVYADSPDDEAFELQDFVEMFSDWGWNRSTDKPEWFLEL